MVAGRSAEQLNGLLIPTRRSLVWADGLLNPPLPGVHLEHRLEPCGSADLSILEKEAPAGAILLDLIRPKSQTAQLIRAAPAMTS